MPANFGRRLALAAWLFAQTLAFLILTLAPLIAAGLSPDIVESLARLMAIALRSSQPISP